MVDVATITSATTAELSGVGVTEPKIVGDPNIRTAVGSYWVIGAANGIFGGGIVGTAITDITYPIAVNVGLVGIRKKWAIIFIAAKPIAVDIVIGIFGAAVADISNAVTVVICLVFIRQP